MLPASLDALSLDAPPGFLDLLELPRQLVLAIFLLIPVDMRLSCSEVSRAWRALLADTSFWTSLDLSIHCGLNRYSEVLLRAAVAKAGGQLRSLDITGQHRGDPGIFYPGFHLHALVRDNAATLTELRVDTREHYSAEGVRSLLVAAPELVS